jgi:hypothetical protein
VFFVLNAQAQSGRARTKAQTCQVRGFAAHRRFDMATHRPARESSTGPAPQTPRQPGTSATRLVSFRDAAEVFGVSVKTIRRRIADGTVTGYGIGTLIRVDLTSSGRR